MKPNPDYDFNPAIEKTSTELAKTIVSEINARSEKLFFVLDDNVTPEQKLQQDIDFSELMVSLVKTIAKTDIPMDYATWPVERIIGMLTIIKNQIQGTVRATQDEILSGFYGVRSPKTGKLASDCVTFGQAMERLAEMKAEKGYKDSDYYTNVNEEVVEDSKSE